MANRRNAPQVRRAEVRQRRFRSLAERKADERKERQRARRKQRLIISWVLVVGIAAFLFYGIFVLVNNLKRFEHADVTGENTTVSGYSSYIDLDSGVLAYGNSGMCFIGPDGNVIWRTNFTMYNPKAVVNGNYGAVADIARREAMIFTTSGVTGRVSTENPVLNLAVSSSGVLALAQDKGEGGEIRFYKANGSALDIRIGTLIAESGYPLEMAMSPSGKRLVMSGAVFGKGSLQTCLKFYDLSSSEAEESEKTVEFSFGDTVFPSMTFLSEDRLCAFGDDRLCIFSYAADQKPTLSFEEVYEDEVVRVMASPGRIGVVMRRAGSDDLIFRQYNASGRSGFEKTVPDGFSLAGYSGEYAVFASAGRVLVMTSWGRVRYEGDLGDTSLWLRFTGDKTFLQFTSDKIKEYSLS